MPDSETVSVFEKILSVVFSLPVIILLIVIIFRKQILSFFRIFEEKFKKQEVSEFSVGSGGVSAKFLKAETSIGETNVTVAKNVYDSNKDNLVTYTSGQHKFRISWDEKHYYGTSDTQAAEKALHQAMPDLILSSLSFVINRKQPFLGFSPNVNVLVGPLEPETSITKHTHLNTIGLKNAGMEVVSVKVDTNSQSSFIECRLPQNESPQFIKLAITKDMAYAVTMTVAGVTEESNKGVPSDLLKKAEIKNELRTILNSFELITLNK